MCITDQNQNYNLKKKQRDQSILLLEVDIIIGI